MAEIESVKIVNDNTKKILNELDSTVDKTLKAIGIAAVGYAAPITPVDTGLARNSITFALHGKKPDKGSYADNSGNQRSEYKGNAPEQKRTVFIGSNVEYFEGLEEGQGGRAGYHMLRKAVTEHGDEYKNLTEKYLKEAKD